jgi:hypothetical protein
MTSQASEDQHREALGDMREMLASDGYALTLVGTVKQ